MKSRVYCHKSLRKGRDTGWQGRRGGGRGRPHSHMSANRTTPDDPPSSAVAPLSLRSSSLFYGLGLFFLAVVAVIAVVPSRSSVIIMSPHVSSSVLRCSGGGGIILPHCAEERYHVRLAAMTLLCHTCISPSILSLRRLPWKVEPGIAIGKEATS